VRQDVPTHLYTREWDEIYMRILPIELKVVSGFFQRPLRVAVGSTLGVLATPDFSLGGRNQLSAWILST